MKIVITTQYKENYGAHTWDGEGECPQYWKFKGGSEYMVEGIDKHIPLDDQFAEAAKAVVDTLRPTIENSDDYSETYILDWSIEEDDYMSNFERSQIDYYGEITHSEPKISMDKVVEMMGAKA